MTSEAVRVVGRIRPEIGVKNEGVLDVQDDQTIVLLPKRYNEDDRMAPKRSRETSAKGFKLDHVYGPNSTQLDLFSTTQPLSLSVTAGYNATIFAYGHTGSGKTHTMMGTGSDPGIIPRTIADIFRAINETAAAQPETMFLVRMSYVELYNNQFRNLLDWGLVEYTEQSDGAVDKTSGNRMPRVARSDRIEVRENKVAGVHLSGPGLRAPVTNPENVMRLIASGNRLRAVAATNCNEHSSRSHAILTLHIESRSGEESSSEVRVGKLHLVDLAGSERVSLSGAEGSTLVETQNINLSLSTLGDVLSALSRNATATGDGGGTIPVPYRNSKLTHLLKDSLGGNSKTLMVATLRSTHEFHAQSLMTLMYATRAKRIRNFAAVNRDTQGGSGIHQVAEDIAALRHRLMQRTEEFDRLRDLHSSDAQENQVLRSRLTEIGRVNEIEKTEMEMKVAQVIHNQAGVLAVQRRQVTDLQARLTEELSDWQHKCAEQKAEIIGLRNIVTALEQVHSDHGATQEEVSQMRGVLEAWQAQATSAQQELLVVSNKLRSVAEQRSVERRRVKELELDVGRLEGDQVDAARKKKEDDVTIGRVLADTELQLSQCRDDAQKLRTEAAHAREAAQQVENKAAAQDLLAVKQCAEADLKNGAIQEKLADLSRRMEVAETERVVLREQAAESQAEVEVFRRETARLEELNSCVKHDLSTQKEAADDQLNALEKEHSKLLHELRRFQSSLIAMQSDMQQVVDEKNALCEENKRISTEVSFEHVVLAHSSFAGEVQLCETAIVAFLLTY